MASPRNIIVSGANRGIGRAICEAILSRPNLGPIKLFAASRAGRDFGLSSQNEDQKIIYPPLDVSDHKSISSLQNQVKQHGPVYALINNAGINLDNEYNKENAQKTLDVNYWGTVDMCETFLPDLSPEGSRIVNLSSVVSRMKIEIAAKQRIINATTKEELDQIAKNFETAILAGSETLSGFGGPRRSYTIAKALIRAYTTILSNNVNASTWSPKILINSCCPGWVDTDMGRSISSQKTPPPKTPLEAARIPVRLALDGIDGVTGKYWANPSVRYKDDGQVEDWGNNWVK